MPERVLGERELNRAMLARQLLLGRSRPRTLEAVCPCQSRA
jgi:hypothetical protein